MDYPSGPLAFLLSEPLANLHQMPFPLESSNPYPETMGFNGRTLGNVSLVAIDGVNQRGSILGRPLHPAIEDEASAPDVFAEKAYDLIQQQQVKTIFGCWTSASRKVVLPIVEETNNQ